MTLRRIRLEACPECDALLNPALPEIGEKAHCPRCGFLLERPRKNSVERTLALSIAGLVLLFPANLLPLVGIQVLGNTRDGVLFSGVVSLIAENMWGVALLVLLSSILFPALNVALSLLISAHLFCNRPDRRLPLWMRTLQHLDEWAMLEVYMLGIIVAVVKLSDMAELRFGLGLYAFIGLLIVTSLLSSNLDKVLFWRRIDELLGDSSRRR